MQPISLASSIASLTGRENTTTPAKSGKLHEAAQQFEALMIGEMMKTVRESSDSGWLGTGGDDPSSDQAVEMAEQHFAKALALSGGMGLSKMVEQKVGDQASQPSVKPTAL